MWHAPQNSQGGDSHASFPGDDMHLCGRNLKAVSQKLSMCHQHLTKLMVAM